MLLIFKFRNYSSLWEVSIKCVDIGKEFRLRCVQLLKSDGEWVGILRTPFPEGKWEFELLSVQLGDELQAHRAKAAGSCTFLMTLKQ